LSRKRSAARAARSSSGLLCLPAASVVPLTTAKC